MDWRRLDDQFQETSGEVRARWRETKARRRRERKCWQCAKSLPVGSDHCDCGAKNNRVQQE
jgi:hypothetical protein